MSHKSTSSGSSKQPDNLAYIFRLLCNYCCWLYSRFKPPLFGCPLQLLRQTYALQLLTHHSRQFVVGADGGKVLRGSWVGAPPAPKEYIADDHMSEAASSLSASAIPSSATTLHTSPFYPSAFLAGAFCFCSLKLCAVGNLRHPRGFCVEQAGLSACMCLCQQYVDSGTPCASSCSLQCSHVSPPAALQAMIRSGTQPSIILKFTECWLVLTNLYGRRSVQ